MLPDGIVAHVNEPAGGTCNDSVILQDSALPGILAQYAHHPDGHALKLYGDSAYASDTHIAKPRDRGQSQAARHVHENQVMGTGRIVVEQAIGYTNQFFKQSKWLPAMGIMDGRTGHFFRLSVLFANYRTCICYFNNVSLQYMPYYDDFPLIRPPTLKEYLNPNLFSLGVDIE
ncbi:hypothetical protein EC957_010679 [Mortierella hygrophila]|uniref:DDE Tnp4 domain-containing protein n=1 Tax=Mortierella hygrophila TaxID=979708 RepID=A0A9P6F9I3_9FUNG|nr:hypothetical protein EC957_010679 [Mortierella hygrophila]